MSGCRIGCGHRALVEGYRQERERQLVLAEARSAGYLTELLEWLESHPLVTFRQWLRAHTVPVEVRSEEVAA